MPPRYRHRRRPRRSRWKPRRRSKWKPRRRKNKKTYHDKMRSTSDVSLVLARNKRLTLKQRVKALEGEMSKHWDTIGPLPLSAGGLSINWNGVSYTGQPATSARNSFPTLLAIQPMNGDGTISRYSDNFNGQEDNQRRGDTVFVTKARLRGRLQARLPKPYCQDISGTTGPVPPSGEMPSNLTIQGNSHYESLTYTKVWMVILQDKRPSIVGTNGESDPNPLGEHASTDQPIRSISQFDRLGQSTLQTYGFANMLRSYDSTRFKVKLAKCFTMSAAKPQVDFDVTVSINKKLRYKPLDNDQTNPTVTQPLNYNLITYFITETDLPDLAGEFYKPVLSQQVSRVYFKDN